MRFCSTVDTNKHFTLLFTFSCKLRIFHAQFHVIKSSIHLITHCSNPIWICIFSYFYLLTKVQRYEIPQNWSNILKFSRLTQMITCKKKTFLESVCPLQTSWYMPVIPAFGSPRNMFKVIMDFIWMLCFNYQSKAKTEFVPLSALCTS